MGIWIRAQDKMELLEIIKIKICNSYQNSRIVGIDRNGYENTLGIYKTKESAIKILNEIQNKLLKVAKRNNKIQLCARKK